MAAIRQLPSGQRSDHLEDGSYGPQRTYVVERIASNDQQVGLAVEVAHVALARLDVHVGEDLAPFRHVHQVRMIRACSGVV